MSGGQWYPWLMGVLIGFLLAHCGGGEEEAAPPVPFSECACAYTWDNCEGHTY